MKPKSTKTLKIVILSLFIIIKWFQTKQQTETCKTNEHEEEQQRAERYSQRNKEVNKTSLNGSGAKRYSDDVGNTSYHSTESLTHNTHPASADTYTNTE